MGEYTFPAVRAFPWYWWHTAFLALVAGCLELFRSPSTYNGRFPFPFVDAPSLPGPRTGPPPAPVLGGMSYTAMGLPPSSFCLVRLPTPCGTGCRTPAMRVGMLPAGGGAGPYAGGPPCSRPLRLLLCQHCHVQREATNPCKNVRHSPLRLVLLDGLELAQGPN